MSTLLFQNPVGSYTLSGGTLDVGGAGSTGANLIKQTAAVTGTNTIGSVVTLSTGGTLNLQVNGGAVNITGLITGFTGGLNKIGAGTLILGTADTYTGTTSVNGGTLRLGILNALPGQPLVINGAVVDLAGYSDSIGTLTMNAGTVADSGGAAVLSLGGDIISAGASTMASNVTIGLGAARNFGVNSGLLTINGSVTGAFTVTKTGSGTLLLNSSADNFTGITVNTGTVRVGANNVNLYTLNEAAGAIIDANGQNLITSIAGPTGTNTGMIILNGGTLMVGANGYNSNTDYYPNVIAAGGGYITKTGTGVAQIRLDSVVTRALVSVQQGTLQIADGGASRNTGMVAVTMATGTSMNIDKGANSSYLGSISGAGTLSEAGAGGTITIGGVNPFNPLTPINFTFSGAFNRAFTKIGNGTMTLNGASADASTTAYTINAGGVVLNGNGAITGPTAMTIANGAFVTLDNSGTAVGTRLPTTMTLTLNGGTFNFIGNSAGSTQTLGNLTIGAGGANINVTSNGTNAYLTFGTLTSTTAGGTLNITEAGPTAYATTTTGVTNGILGGGRVTVNGNDFAAKSGNNIVALGSYGAFQTTGNYSTTNMLLSGIGSLTGAMTSGTLKITTTGASDYLNLGANVLTLASNALLFAGSSNYTISGSTGTLGASGSEVILEGAGAGILSIASPISGGAGLLTKAGAGTVQLTGTSTYTGATRVEAGTLQMGANNPILPTSALTVYEGATLALNGFTYTNSATGSGSGINLAGGTISGSGSSVLATGPINNGDHYLIASNGGGTISVPTINLGAVTTNAWQPQAAELGDVLNINASIIGTAYNIQYGGYGTIVVTGSSNYTTNTTMNNSVRVIAQNSAAFGAANYSFSVANAGNQLVLQDTSGSGLNIANTINIRGSGWYSDSTGALRVMAGANGGSNHDTISGNVTINLADTFIGLDPGTQLTLVGQLTGAFNWDIIGGGTLVLNNGTTSNAIAPRATWPRSSRARCNWAPTTRRTPA